VDRDAAVGVPGDADHRGAASEVEQVTFGQLPVYAAGRHAGQAAAGRGHDASVQRTFLVGQDGRWAGLVAPDNTPKRSMCSSPGTSSIVSIRPI
jgi:hypothetical protein